MQLQSCIRMVDNAKLISVFFVVSVCMPWVARSTTLPFPKGFLFGGSTSSHQIEGGYLADGKKMDMWDHMTNNVHRHMENANEACKSYPDHYEKDLKLMKEANLNIYRFSFSWTRLLPHGELKNGSINKAGLAYYDNLVDELLKHGIEPVVTIYHWDLPNRFQEDFGGWVNPMIIDFLEDYAYFLFKHFGNRVKRWITINEPTMILHGYENGNESLFAPAKSLHSPANYHVVHNMLRAHARICHLYKTEFRDQHGQIGISLVGSTYRPKNPADPEDVRATHEAYQFYIGIYAHPIFSKEGDYPEIVRRIVDQNSENEGRRRSRLPEFTEEEKKLLKGSADFFGLNHYMTENCARNKPNADGTFSAFSRKRVKYHKDLNPLDSFGEDLKVLNEPLDEPEPKGFQDILKYIKDTYQNPPILVTENGYGVNGTDLSKEELIHDRDRVEYYKSFLSAVLRAIHEDKVNVIGYSTWSLMDNFEWSRGYTWKYGIVHVDFDHANRTRTPKDSHAFFKEIIKNGSLEIVPY